MPTPDYRPQPIGPGDAAPSFMLPAVDDAAPVSLDDYRGRSALFLALLIGLWCPFCRRHIALIGAVEDRLKALGVRTLAVVATTPENARLYFRFRPTKLKLAADPELMTHRAYGVPKPEPTPALIEEIERTVVNPFGDFPQPLPLSRIGHLMDEQEGFRYTPTDQADVERQWPQLKGHFLIDRSGIVRSAWIECAEGLATIGQFPGDDELLGAARALAH